jgi:hypothetical protein
MVFLPYMAADDPADMHPKYGNMKASFALCAEIEAALKALFAAMWPINMPLEKVFYVFYLRAKKRYAGYMQETLDGKFKLKVTGFETVRRSTCTAVATMLKKCLHYLIVEADPDRAFAHAKQKVVQLLEGRENRQGLVLTGSMSKDTYVTPPALKQLQRRLLTERRENVFEVGQRVSYMYIVGNTHTSTTNALRTKLGDMIELRDYVAEHNIPINYQAYLDKQYRNPLLGIFAEIDTELVTMHADDAERVQAAAAEAAQERTARAADTRALAPRTGVQSRVAKGKVCRPRTRMERVLAEAEREARRVKPLCMQTGKIGGFLHAMPRCINCSEVIRGAPSAKLGRDAGVKRARTQALHERHVADIEDLYAAAEPAEAALAQQRAHALMQSETLSGLPDRVLFEEHYAHVTPALCTACAHTRNAHLIDTTRAVARLEARVHAAWSECLTCANNHTAADMCSNKDCPISSTRLFDPRDLETQRLMQRSIACC